MSGDNTADTIARFVGGRLIAGDTIPQIVEKLDQQLAEIRREYAIASTSVLTSPAYSMIKAVADNLRARC
jgi:predicted transcriptional regulator